MWVLLINAASHVGLHLQVFYTHCRKCIGEGSIPCLCCSEEAASTPAGTQNRLCLPVPAAAQLLLV